MFFVPVPIQHFEEGGNEEGGNKEGGLRKRVEIRRGKEEGGNEKGWSVLKNPIPCDIPDIHVTLLDITVILVTS